MTTLTRWTIAAGTDARDATLGSAELTTSDPAEIAAELKGFGIRFEQWPVKPLPAGAGQDDVLAAYRSEVDQLMAEGGYKVVDVAQLHPPADRSDATWRQTAEGARSKFLNEHTHAEDEVRFFVSGAGIFYLHLDDNVLAVRCEQGDLISVPALTRHWFDMGTDPDFTAIRLFLDPEGWVGTFTGSDIAARYPDFATLSPA